MKLVQRTCLALTLVAGIFSCSAPSDSRELENSLAGMVFATDAVSNGEHHKAIGWREHRFADKEALLNVPLVHPAIRQGRIGWLAVKVQNVGQTVLQYSGYSRLSPQMLQEVWDSNSWVGGRSDWCLEGMKTFWIHPGDTITLHVRFYKSESLQRILTSFKDKGTGRHSMVVLATQLPFEHD